MKKILLVFVVLSIICSCKKSKPFSATGELVEKQYENGFLTHFTSVKLFTKKGEITDPILVENYRNEFGDYLFDGNKPFLNANYKSFLTYKKDDSLINNSTSYRIYAKKIKVDVYDKYETNLVPELLNDTSDVSLHIVKYKVHEQKKTSTGFLYTELEYPYFAKVVNDTLFFPLIKYIKFSRPPGYSFFTSDLLNNVFSPSGTNKLRESDTLMVQSFDLGLRRIK